MLKYLKISIIACFWVYIKYYATYGLDLTQNLGFRVLGHGLTRLGQPIESTRTRSQSTQVNESAESFGTESESSK